MLRVKVALFIGMIAVGLVSPTNLQVAQTNSLKANRATETNLSEFSVCPLPIPNCIPEKVFDFKTCRCVPRP